jgi:hypothetical protein
MLHPQQIIRFTHPTEITHSLVSRRWHLERMTTAISFWWIPSEMDVGKLLGIFEASEIPKSSRRCSRQYSMRFSTIFIWGR